MEYVVVSHYQRTLLLVMYLLYSVLRVDHTECPIGYISFLTFYWFLDQSFSQEFWHYACAVAEFVFTCDFDSEIFFSLGFRCAGASSSTHLRKRCKQENKRPRLSLLCP